MEIICLSCCHLQGVEGLGVVMSLINTLIENLWRAEQHLPTRLMLVLLPLFILALTAACTVYTSGTRTRLATAMHGNWWKFMKIAEAKGTFLKLFDFPIKHNWVMREKKKLLPVGLFCITSWAVQFTLQVWAAGGDAVLAGFCSQQGHVPGGIRWYLRQFFLCFQVLARQIFKCWQLFLKVQDFGVSRGLSRGNAAAVCIVLGFRQKGEGGGSTLNLISNLLPRVLQGCTTTLNSCAV